MLSGLLHCGECGSTLLAKPPRKSQPNRWARGYWCAPMAHRGCNRVSISAHLVESFIVDAVFQVLNQEIRDDSPQEEVALLATVASDRAQLDELAAAYASRQFTLREWLAARAPIERRIAELEARLSDRATVAAGRVASPQTLAESWKDLDVDRQRAIVHSVLDHVVVKRVGRGARFTPDRLVPVWRT